MLEHDDAEVTVRFNGRQDEDRAEPRVAAGLVQQEQSKIVEVLAAVLETLGHRRALDEQMAVDQHAAGFARRVHVDRVDRLPERHGQSLMFGDGRRGLCQFDRGGSEDPLELLDMLSCERRYGGSGRGRRHCQ